MKNRKIISFILVVMLIFSQGQIAFGLEEGDTADTSETIVVKNEESTQYVVKFKDTTKSMAMASAEYGTDDVEVIEEGKVAVVDFDSTSQANQVLDNLAKSDEIAFIEPIYPNKAFVGNDPYYDADWQWGLNAINPADTWARVDDDDLSNITIAILDSGVDAEHPDLQANLVDGYNFVEDNTDTDDIRGHGTHVAGIAAAIGNNNEGIIGVASGAKIMPIKVLDDSGNGNTYQSYLGIRYAVDHGADIINMSYGSSYISLLEKDAIDYANSKGVICVGAAGNEGGTVGYPAGFENVICVGAAMLYDTHDMRIASYSNYGTEVDVMAPGSDILSTIPLEKSIQDDLTGFVENGYGFKTGTSMASPFVAGYAALLKAENNDRSFEDVLNIMQSNTVPLGNMDAFGGTLDAEVINLDDDGELMSQGISFYYTDLYISNTSDGQHTFKAYTNKSEYVLDSTGNTTLSIYKIPISSDFAQVLSGPSFVGEITVSSGSGTAIYTIDDFDEELYVFYCVDNNNKYVKNSARLSTTNKNIDITLSLPEGTMNLDGYEGRICFYNEAINLYDQKEFVIDAGEVTTTVSISVVQGENQIYALMTYNSMNFYDSAYYIGDNGNTTHIEGDYSLNVKSDMAINIDFQEITFSSDGESNSYLIPENIGSADVEYSAAIDYIGDRDWFKVTLPSDGDYVFEALDIENEVEINVYEGNTLEYWNVSEGYNSFEIDDLSSGEYLVLIKGYNDKVTGDYTLKISSTGSDLTNYESINIEETKDVSIDFEGDMDYLSFTVTEADMYGVFVDTRYYDVKIVDLSGISVLSEDYGYNSTSKYVAAKLDAGTYYIEVFSDIISSCAITLDKFEPITFTDSALQTAIAEYADVLEHNIFLPVLYEVENWDLSDANITTIEGIEYLRMADTINLSNNNISDLGPLFNCDTAFTAIDLSNNNIETIPNIINSLIIYELDLSGNQITSIENLKQSLFETFVFKLYLNDNLINDVSHLAQFINIDALDISNNLINDITFLNNMWFLKVLNIDNNPITNYSPFEAIKSQLVDEILWEGDIQFVFNNLRYVDDVITSRAIISDNEFITESDLDFKWYLSDTSNENGTYSEIATVTDSYITIANEYGGKYLKLEAEINKESYVGDAFLSDPIGPIRTLPTASNVTISAIGGIKTGSTATASYDYGDLDGDSESGSIYQWYICDTADGTYAEIAGKTELTYITTDADAGKYLKFMVTPKTTEETGTTVAIAAFGPILPVPVASDLTISGIVYIDEALTGDYTYSDPANTTENGTAYRWLVSDTVNGTYVEINGATNTTYTLTTNEVDKYIKYEVTPMNTDNVEGVTQLSAAVGPVRTLPTASNVTISAIGGIKTGSTATASYDYGDLDGDSESGSSYQWYICDTADGTYAEIAGKTELTYTTTDADAGKYLKFMVTPKTTEETGETVTSAAFGPIIPVPVATNVTIAGIVYMDETMTGDYDYDDPASTPESGTTYRWLVSDTLVGTYTEINGATSEIYLLTSDEVGKYIKYEVTPKNSANEEGVTQTSEAVGPIKTLPTASSATIAAISGIETGNSITGQYTYDDLDGDAEGTSVFKWYISDTIDGVYSEIIGATNVSYMLVRDDADKYIKFEVTPYSSESESGQTVSSSGIGPIISLPVAENVTIAGINRIGNTLEADYDYDDPVAEGDSTYKWYRSVSNDVNGNYEEITGETTTAYALVDTDAGKYIKFEVTPKSSAQTGVEQTSEAFGPIKSNPEITSTTISGIVRENSIVTADSTFADLDGDTIGSQDYVWMLSDAIDGTYSNIVGATNVTYSPINADVSKYIKFSTTIQTSSNEFVTATSEAIQIGEAGDNPEVTAVAISGTAKQGNTLTASYTYEDTENDPEENSLITWYRGESATTTFTSIQTGTEKTYTLTTDDIGYYIIYVVTPRSQANEYGDILTSSAIGPVAKKSTSSGGGGGGGSFTPPTSADGEIEKGKDGETTLKVEVGKKDLDIKDDIATLSAKSDTETDKVEVKISISIIEDLNKKENGMRVETNDVVFEFDAESINTDEIDEDAELSLNVEAVPQDELEDADFGDFDVEGDNVQIFDFEIKVGDGTVDTFKKPIRITLTYDKDNFENEAKVGVYYLNEETNSWEYVGGEINEDGTISFETTHFSKYAIMEYTKTFEDISIHWAKESIEIMASKQITNGLSESLFAPNNRATRAEFVTWLVRALMISETPEKNHFTDIAESKWYYNTVNVAFEQGLVNGVGNDTFAPNKAITRQEMAILITNAYEYKTGKSLKDLIITQEVRFNDILEVSSWARERVNLANALDLVTGYVDKTYRPRNNTSRAEAIVVIERLIENY